MENDVKGTGRNSYVSIDREASTSFFFFFFFVSKIRARSLARARVSFVSVCTEEYPIVLISLREISVRVFSIYPMRCIGLNREATRHLHRSIDGPNVRHKF